MRKRIVRQPASESEPVSPETWVNLEQIVTVEMTSEDPDFPIESVFNGTSQLGWRAVEQGNQQIRLIFDQPISVKRIRLRFVETEVARTQEFTLGWSGVQGGRSREIVRQKWNFSPSGSTSEVEEYWTNLDGVAVLELAIQPDLYGGAAKATLAEWRIA
jgi:hypothetical protein